MSDANRREHPRFDATELPAAVGFNQPLRLIDLSAGGALVETSEWLAPGKRYSLRIGTPPLQVTVTVMRSRLVRVEPTDNGSRSLYEAGVSFEGASTQVRQQIAALTTQLASQTDEQKRPQLRLVAQ